MLKESITQNENSVQFTHYLVKYSRVASKALVFILTQKSINSFLYNNT